MKVITVAHAKGGVAKTTSAGFLAFALANAGHRPLVIDADPQGSMLRWSRRGRWPIPVRHLASATLDLELAGLMTDDYDVAIIDTKPNDAAIMEAAMRSADLVILPTSPMLAEIAEVKTTYAMAARAGVEADGVRILLNRVFRGTDARDAREAMTAAGRRVLRAEIPHRVATARAFAGTPARWHGYGGYTGAALEIMEILA